MYIGGEGFSFGLLSRVLMGWRSGGLVCFMEDTHAKSAERAGYGICTTAGVMMMIIWDGWMARARN